MGKIIKKLPILGDKGESRASILFDSGAGDSVVQKEVAERVSTIISSPRLKTFTLADGKTEVKTKKIAILFLTLDGVSIDDEFYVLEDLSREVILGASTMQKWDIHLHLREEEITVGRNPDKIELA